MFIQTADGEYINLTSCVSKVKIESNEEEKENLFMGGRSKVTTYKVHLTLWNNSTTTLEGERAANFVSEFKKITV